MNNVALLISTYDNSEDLWNLLEKTYLRYWHDINLPIYLTTNHKIFNGRLFNSLAIGDELSWSDNLIKSLNSIKEEYVLLTFDDLFLTATVDNQFIEQLMSRAISSGFNYLQFYKSTSKGSRVDNLIFRKSNVTRYKNSTIWSFWKKDVLLALLQKNEDAWQFERDGNLRSHQYQGFYSTRANVIPFVNGIVKGIWNPLAKKKLNGLGFLVSSDRITLSWLKTLKYKFRDLQFDILAYIIHKIY